MVQVFSSQAQFGRTLGDELWISHQTNNKKRQFSHALKGNARMFAQAEAAGRGPGSPFSDVCAYQPGKLSVKVHAVGSIGGHCCFTFLSWQAKIRSSRTLQRKGDERCICQACCIQRHHSSCPTNPVLSFGFGQMCMLESRVCALRDLESSLGGKLHRSFV